MRFDFDDEKIIAALYLTACWYVVYQLLAYVAREWLAIYVSSMQ